MTVSRIAIAIALVSCSIPIAGAAQATGADGAAVPVLSASRMRLYEHAGELEQLAQAAGKSEEIRTAAARDAADIRKRLAEGDFKVGDRILLVVEGEATLSDTFTVGLGPTLTLPSIGEVSLEGVLRSELQDYLKRRLAQNLRDPGVRATAYIRLSVVGAVVKPGYYGVPAQALLSDVLMSAGGPAPNAKIQDARIERAGHAILEKKALQQAIAQGRTIDEAGLIAGDQYIIPPGGTSSTKETIGFVALLLTIPITIYSLTQIWKK